MEQEKSFDGKFTQSMRERLRKKRLSLGVRIPHVAQALGVAWQTYAKWEQGGFQVCHSRNILQVQRYLDGMLDEEILLCQKSAPSGEKESEDSTMKPAFHLLANVYALCGEFPELQKEFRHGLLDDLWQVLHSLLLEL
ncbi:MAG: helix-turn-helix transcriptional regulator [Victivallales bacterium]|nr:helix-turn-helix transcriptional regulator [Victivallales bacterium]